MEDCWNAGIFRIKNAFTIASISIPVRYSKNDYYIELVPALRKVKLTTLLSREIAVSSSALDFKSGLYLGKHFRLSGSVYSFTYSRDISKLASIKIIQFFSRNTLLLSSSLLTKSYNLEAGLDFDSFSVSVGENRSVSAIDNTSSDYAYSVLDYYLSDSWSLSFLYGVYLDAPENENNYSSLSLSYSF